MKIKPMNKEQEKEDMIWIKPHYKLTSQKNKQGESEYVRILCNGFWKRRNGYKKREKEVIIKNA